MDHIAGADLHKRVTQLALLRDGQPASQGRFANDRVTVEGALNRLPTRTTIAVESTGSWCQAASVCAVSRALASEAHQGDRHRPLEVGQG